MLEIQVPKDQTKLLRQIKALKGLIKTDNPKDAQNTSTCIRISYKRV